MPTVSIIVPVYNEQNTVGQALQQIERIRPLLPSTEVIVVDDGSTDATASEIRKFPFVRCIAHEENQGKGAALRTGFRVAAGDVLVIQDSDSEYPPSNIPKLLEPILDGEADLVCGSRFKGRHDGMSISHYFGNKILSLATELLCGVPITDVMTGHKSFRREAIESIDLKEDGFEVEMEMTVKILNRGWRFAEVPIKYSKRSLGSEKIRYRDGLASLLKLLEEWVHLLLRRSQMRRRLKSVRKRRESE